ncbi:MAG: PAS domain-containing protein, partial [Chloroflexota bacterium]|nr:PAS domain-containing protein [Chloroflexota bacterium]
MDSTAQTGISVTDDIFTGRGEVGKLMRSIDWTQTPLGSIETWPQSLRTAISICLASRFPMLIWWGPELVMLYNDAYLPILATKHPKAMGQRGKECWPEIWNIIGPMLEGVLIRGEATWSENQLLLLERNGYPEECYFTFSYSPIRDESGGVGGIFTAVSETTGQVLGDRRLRTLHDLAERAGEAKTAEEVCFIATEMLAGNTADIPFALLYLLDNDGKQASLAGSFGVNPDSLAGSRLVDLTQPEGFGQWPLAQVASTGQPALVDSLSERFGVFTTMQADGITPHSALVLPIARSGQQIPYGLLVVGISPLRT